MKRPILVLLLGLWVGASLISCGGSFNVKRPPSGLLNRVLASQGVSAGFSSGGLVLINGQNDTLTGAREIGAGNAPGLMAISPTKNLLLAFDSASQSVYAVNTVTETSLGSVRLSGQTSSMVVPTASLTAYAAVPTATAIGFTFTGGVQVINLSLGTITTTIGVTNAQTVVANSIGSQLLVFSNDSDSVTVLSPASAVPPVDTSCFNNPPNAVCSIIPGFSRPFYAVVSGSTAYILNCGLPCGGTQPASVMVFDLGTLTVTNTIPVDAATMAFLVGSTLYVAGTPTTNNDCTGQMWGTPPQSTAATVCGRLDVVDLNSGTVTSTFKITDGTHDRMDMSANGELFIGSYGCTDIGNVNNPSGEVRGCLSILNTTTNSVIIPPDNGDVTGLQGFSSRNIEYVAENGVLRVYDTTRNILLINDFLPQGTINIVGKVGDVKAIDFF